MTMASRLRRQVISVIGVAVAALSATLLAPAPAHATLGPALPIDVQLRSYYNGGEYLVGRVVGTIQFDTNNVQYKLSVTVCRQSSYTSPNVRIYVNGTQSSTYSGEDNIRRQICSGHGMSFVIDNTFTAGGAVVRFVGIGIEGVHFDGSNARFVSGGAGYDNPYN